MKKHKLIFGTSDLQLIELILLHLDVSNIFIYGNDLLIRALQSGATPDVYKEWNYPISDIHCVNRLSNESDIKMIYEKDKFNTLNNETSFRNVTLYSDCDIGYKLLMEYKIEENKKNYILKIRQSISLLSELKEIFINFSKKNIPQLKYISNENLLISMQMTLMKSHEDRYIVGIHFGLSNLSDKYERVFQSLLSSNHLHRIERINYDTEKTIIRNVKERYSDVIFSNPSISFQNIINKNKFLNNYKSLNDIYISLNKMSMFNDRISFNNKDDILMSGSGDYLIDNFLIITYLLSYLLEFKDDFSIDIDMPYMNSILTKNTIFKPLPKPIFL